MGIKDPWASKTEWKRSKKNIMGGCGVWRQKGSGLTSSLLHLKNNVSARDGFGMCFSWPSSSSSHPPPRLSALCFVGEAQQPRLSAGMITCLVRQEGGGGGGL